MQAERKLLVSVEAVMSSRALESRTNQQEVRDASASRGPAARLEREAWVPQCTSILVLSLYRNRVFRGDTV